MKNLVEDEELKGNVYDMDNFINALKEVSQAGDWKLTHHSNDDLNDVWRVIMKKHGLPNLFRAEWIRTSKGYTMKVFMKLGKQFNGLSQVQIKALWNKLNTDHPYFSVGTYNPTDLWNRGYIRVPVKK